MKYLLYTLIVLATLLFSGNLIAQDGTVRPDQFPTKTNPSPDDAVYSQEDDGSPVKILFVDARKYFGTQIIPEANPPQAVNNPENLRNKLIQVTGTNELWYCDFNGLALKVFDPSAGGGRVFKIDVIADTSNISNPRMGDVFYVDSLTSGYRTQDKWLVSTLGVNSFTTGVYQINSLLDTTTINDARQGDLAYIDSLTFAFRGFSKWLVTNVDPLRMGIGTNGVIDTANNSFSYSDYFYMAPSIMEFAPAGAMQLFLRRFGNNVNSNEFVTSKARGDRENPLSVQNNDILGGIEFHAYDGTAYRQAGRIIPFALNHDNDNTWDSRWSFETGKDSINNGYIPLEISPDGAVLNYDVEFSDYGQGNKTADSLSKTESGYLATYATDGTLLESRILTLEDTALVLGLNRLYTTGNYVLNYGINNSAYNSNDYASLFVGTRNFTKAGRSVFHFAVGDDIFPNYTSTGRQLFGFGSTILPNIQTGSDIFAFGDKVAISATLASNAFIFGNFDTRNCRDLSASFVFNAGNWEILKEARGSILLSTLIHSPVENSSADSTANNSFLALKNVLKNATHKDDAIAIGRNAGAESTGLQPIVFGKDCQGTTVDYQSIVAPNYYTRLSAGLFDFDIDQDTTNKQGQALRLGEDGEIRFIKVEQSGSSNNTTDANGDITISHALGTNQIVVTTQTTGTTFYHIQVHSKTTSNFKIRVFDSTGAVVVSTAVSVDWAAFKL